MVASRTQEWDAAIAGAGVAGLSIAATLARAGLRVVCIDPEPPPRIRVGESLDWSAPGLLANLGLGAEDLIRSGVATPKREIRALTSGSDLLVGRPGPWVGRWPLRFEATTLHVDRERLDLALHHMAQSAGVSFVADRVADVEFEGDRVVGFVTASGQRFTALWYLDATGRRRLIQRSGGIGVRTSGRRRIGLWGHVEVESSFAGTMIYLADASDELSWAWEIPVAENRESMGVVMALSRFQSLRRSGSSTGDIFQDEIARFPALQARLPRLPREIHTRSYHPFVSSRVTGANWLMMGEAAAFVDPLSSAGVTLALRHASEAAQVILASPDSPARAGQQLDAYGRRLRAVSSLYNFGIENLMYAPRLRRAVGVRWASRAYVALGYGTNSLYSRLEPTTPGRMVTLALVLRAMRIWANAWVALSRIVLGLRRQPARPAIFHRRSPPFRSTATQLQPISRPRDATRRTE